MARIIEQIPSLSLPNAQCLSGVLSCEFHLFTRNSELFRPIPNAQCPSKE
ncbi:MAG: hypothetical protein ACYTXI_21910 [Nostoc sp.]